MIRELLTSHQLEVMDGVLAHESARRRHLVISLSGAHAYGFPSPDSDLDLKAIHVAPTSELLGFEKHQATFDRSEVIDGVEIDYTSNELQMALMGVLAGNGNYLERFLGRAALQSDPQLEEVRPLVQRALNRRVHLHYRGFAMSQLHEVEKPGATAKRVLYVLRTALTGTHLLRTGELVVDLSLTHAESGIAEVPSLIAAKRAGERVVLSEDDRVRWLSRLGDLLVQLDAARVHSPLPEETSGAELEAWLIELRRRGLARV